MKPCLCCHTKVADDAPTCPRCGEASFASSDGEADEQTAPPTDPSPTDALAEWMAEPQDPYADGAYPARHGRCIAPLDLSKGED